jgi:hypothetical protein
MNQQKFEFIKYEPTPSEKHLGIATIKLYGKLLARFKIVPTKDGSSFFPAAASYKVGDRYESSLILDSNSEKEELDALIKYQVKLILDGGKPALAPQQMQQTTFLDGCPF